MSENKFNKTILLTGATGFLGSHLADRFIKRGYNLIILKRSFSSTERIKHLLGKIISYDIDLTPVRYAFKDHKVDIVIHTATNYGRNGENLSKIVSSNIVFPLELLESSREFGVKIFLSTDTFSAREDGPLDHIYAYNLSKKQLRSWFKPFQKDLRILNMKLEHVYGERDALSKFVPQVIKQLLNNAPEMNLTLGEQKRDFIYVEDVVEAFCESIDKCVSFNPGIFEYEVGTGKSLPIKEFIFLLKNIIKNNVTLLNFGAIQYREKEIMNSFANTQKIFREIGWAPSTDLKKGLEKTVEWYKNNNER